MKSFTLPILSDPEVVALLLDHATTLEGVSGVIVGADGYAVVRHDADVPAALLRAALTPFACA